jgi:hypothetical protein
MKSDNLRKSAWEAGREDREERISGEEADFARANTNERLFILLLASAPAPVTDANRPNLVRAIPLPKATRVVTRMVGMAMQMFVSW